MDSISVAGLCRWFLSSVLASSPSSTTKTLPVFSWGQMIENTVHELTRFCARMHSLSVPPVGVARRDTADSSKFPLAL